MKHKGILAVFLMLFANALPAQYLNDTLVKAHDFEGVTIDGRPYHLYESQAERIILCFWSVDCDYCHDFLKQLRRHVDLKNEYELVTFALADNPRQVQRQVKRRRLTGWHFFDPNGWDGQAFLDYDVCITPTIVLIDKDKNVIGEAYDWEEFEALRRQK
jgi:thioredoxin-related protein